MNTHRETILLAVMAAVTGATPAGNRVYRSRAEAFARDELPAIVVKPGGETPQHIATGLTQRGFDVHLEFHARGTPADQIVDPLIAAAHKVLMADQTLGGAVARLIEKETHEPEFAEADETAVHIAVTYTATYMTTATDITQSVS